MRNLVEAAALVGARKLISEIDDLRVRLRPARLRLLTEDTARWARCSANAHTEQHVAAMRTKEELTFCIPGVDGVSLRYGLFYGPGGTDADRDAASQAHDAGAEDRQPCCPGCTSMTLRPPCSTRSSTVGREGVQHRRRPRRLNFAEHIRATADGVRAAEADVGAGVAAPPDGTAAREMLRTDMRVSNARARDELGWAPRFPTVDEGLADAGRHYGEVVTSSTDVFAEHRNLLFSVAYRMTGSVADAEDIVQNAWLRWSAADTSPGDGAGAVPGQDRDEPGARRDDIGPRPARDLRRPVAAGTAADQPRRRG